MLVDDPVLARELGGGLGREADRQGTEGQQAGEGRGGLSVAAEVVHAVSFLFL